MMNAAQLQTELRLFTGTEHYFYHPMFPKFHYTEGVRFLAQEAQAYWLIEKILSLQTLPCLKSHDRQFWKLSVDDKRAARLVCEDGDSVELYSEDIHYTDFPLPEIGLFFMGQVLLLPSEY
ncbi:MAG TPA: hypothetical protein PLK94_13870 [Alphaproteobacteria bacterium]|nr:hypothetical protein [Alphaproteobacteria bacterium]